MSYTQKFFRSICRSIIVISALSLSNIGGVAAHPGHAAPVTISRVTHVYLQNIIPYYLKIQKGLARGEMSGDVKGAAEEIKRLAAKARRKEIDPSGKKMYKGVALAAEFISVASTIRVARKEFAELNDTLMPFFDKWPSHILEHDLVLYTCKETKQWWLQGSSEKAADPYRGAAAHCADLTEKEE